MKNITLFKLKEKHTRFLTALFNQLHLIIITIVLILYGVETASAQCVASGNQTSYGAGSWIGYVYASVDGANPPSNVFSTTYRGYITQTETFDQDLGSGALSGSTLCGTYSNQFSIRFKMQKNFAAGYYTFTVGGDDGYRLSIDGGATFLVTNFVDHSYASSNSAQVYLSGSKDLVLEYYEQGGESRILFSYTACTNYSTAPTSISGTNSICSGTSTILTADGGTVATGTTHQWGTGGTPGTNIISGQTGASITVSPTTNTTYWVRRIDPAPCNTITATITQAIAVTPSSTDPTSISGTTSLCLGNSTTLTATGGTLVTGSVYEWGTGTTGSNIISGQTSASITVSPAVTTTYWVRKTNTSPCNPYTNAATTTVSITAPTGDQTSYGSGSWIGYVYSGLDAANPPSNAFTATYRGYITEAETFDHNYGTGNVSGANVCGSYANQFSIRHKMQKNFTTGYYTFTVGGDDGYRLSIDGGSTYLINNFIDHGYTTTTSTQVYLSGNTNLILDYYEQGSDSRVSFSYVSCTNYSTAPTGISGSTAFCLSTGGTTLGATGGFEASGASYQWGTGSTPGASIISGANSSTYYINPATAGTYTYWVRRYDPSPCGLYTTGTTQTITVSAASTNPTSITTTGSNVCSGTSITLTATGGTLSPGGYYQWGTGWTVGSNIISGETAVTLIVAPTVSTVYWVRRIDPAPCNTQTPGTTVSITVAARSIAPTGISGMPSACSGSSTTLTATGGTLGTNASYQWGTGTVGNNIIGGATSVSYSPSPTTNTTYWVRIIDAAPCSSSTGGVSQLVTVTAASVQPTGLSGPTSMCNGSSATLTATGGTPSSAGAYQWGTGWTVGSNIISGQTAVTMTVSPTVDTVYWVRIMDGSPCNSPSWTGGRTLSITITNPSTAPSSISGAGSASCSGTSKTLTASGGTAATGSTYQWGTGTVGSNIISGQTGTSITVAPTTTTVYWVRRYDVAPCSSYTTGITTTVSVAAPPGDPAAFGANVWNVYGYSTSDITLATAVYAGTYAVSTLNFDTQSGTNSWGKALSPSSSAGWTGCTVPNDTFTFVTKRKGFPCGTYVLALQNWDDETRIYINGTQVWTCAVWSGGGGGCSGTIGTYALDSNSEIEIRVREGNGDSNLGFTLTNTNTASTAPTSISGTTTVCNGTATTLTATGGTTGTTGTFEWGTGSTVGSNTISGQTAAAITVSPSSSTTYWVRRVDAACTGNITSGVTQLVTVTTGTTAGTLNTTSTTICRNTKPNAITLTGNIGNVLKWQYANDAAFTSGVTDIANTTTTLSSAAMGNLASTRYYRAVVQNGSCTIQNTTPVSIIIPPTLTYSNGAWNGTPDATSSVVISSNLTLNANLNVCSCQVTAGVTVTVNSGSNLIIQTSLTVDNTANIVINDKASLVQVDDSAVDVGNITVFRKSAPMKLYDFTYWSSPVQNWRLNQLSPNTLSDKYFSFDPAINNWVTLTNGTATMSPSKGYIVRAPQGGWSTSNATGGVYEGSFIGAPNTGIVPVTIQKGVGYMNLIGNPYPSAIDIDLFLTDAGNSGLVNGTVYLWTHNTAISSTIPGNSAYNYTADDYAKYNLTGGIKTASAAITGGTAPDGKIASGQGFFIEANTSLGVGTYTANFKNNMRLVGSNNQFYRVNANGTLEAHRSANTAVEKNRLWINISNAQGAYNETLLGYLSGATNGYDNLFDGNTLPAGNVLSLYSISDTHNYAIQGKGLPFVNTDVVPLGYQTTVAGDFTIAIENVDGLFQSQNVYLVDKLNNTTQNLKNGVYSFTTTTGTFDNRFELRFVDSALATDQNIFNEDSVIIYTKDSKINIHSTIAIEEVEVYDMLGRTLFTAKGINTFDFKTNNFKAATEALVVKVKLSNQSIVTRKIIME